MLLAHFNSGPLSQLAAFARKSLLARVLQHTTPLLPITGMVACQKVRSTPASEVSIIPGGGEPTDHLKDKASEFQNTQKCESEAQITPLHGNYPCEQLRRIPSVRTYWISPEENAAREWVFNYEVVVGGLDPQRFYPTAFRTCSPYTFTSTRTGEELTVIGSDHMQSRFDTEGSVPLESLFDSATVGLRCYGGGMDILNPDNLPLRFDTTPTLKDMRLLAPEGNNPHEKIYCNLARKFPRGYLTGGGSCEFQYMGYDGNDLMTLPSSGEPLKLMTVREIVLDNDGFSTWRRTPIFNPTLSTEDENRPINIGGIPHLRRVWCWKSGDMETVDPNSTYQVQKATTCLERLDQKCNLISPSDMLVNGVRCYATPSDDSAFTFDKCGPFGSTQLKPNLTDEFCFEDIVIQDPQTGKFPRKPDKWAVNSLFKTSLVFGKPGM